MPEWPLIISIMSAIIALASLAVAIFALWQTHLAPFRLLVTLGSLQLRMSRFNGHYGVLLIVPISILNTGARVGKLAGIRIRIDGASPGMINSRYVFVTDEMVDYHNLDAVEAKRSRWFPMFVLAKEAMKQNLVFEFATEVPPLADNQLSFFLEVYADDDKKWTEIGGWRTPTLTAEMRSMLAENPEAIFGVPTIDNVMRSDS
jgi:hypothetical protein